jgi:Zn-dependent oligopeptidase
MANTARAFLDSVNGQYAALHHAYEELFWVTYMGDQKQAVKRDKAKQDLDAFRSNQTLRAEACALIAKAPAALKVRLQTWVDFFDQYQLSPEATAMKQKIDALETVIEQKRASRSEGYIDPATGEFVAASVIKMRTMMKTHPDEAVRKACFVAREELALGCIDEYIELVTLRNAFAQALGYEDFYDYKLRHTDHMTKAELFGLFDPIESKAKDSFMTVREMAKKMSGLRQSWNFSHQMMGDFAAEEDQYFQFDQSIERWGRSFAALGVNFKGGTLQLDLIERTGKYNNGFCHWPTLVQFQDGKRVPGAANFTCNVVPGQIGSGEIGYNTLFHEGGHAAHLLNTEQKDVCLNHEYAPMTAAWAETQSMFMDTMFDSIEWKQRYAQNISGEYYPLSLFERKEAKINVLRPRSILSIIFIANFERAVYELKKPTREQVIKIAKAMHSRFFDEATDSLLALNTPHIYSWESACEYHGYGLAEIAVAQWREYFYKKYGYIVDNPNVVKEMRVTWQWGGGKSFPEAIKLATGKKLSSAALIRENMSTTKQVMARAEKRLARMESVKPYTKPIDLGATISMVHGKKEIANNKNGFEAMAKKYTKFVEGLSAKSKQ